MAKAFARYGKNILVEMAKEKAIDTTFKATSSIKNKLYKEVNIITEEAKNIQHDFYHEIRRKFNTAANGTTLLRNPNMSNYDYFENYYRHYNKRYTPTPTPNLAEQLRKHELNLNKNRR